MNKLGFVVVAVFAVGCGDNLDKPEADASVDGSGQSKVARGQYLMNVLGACSFCHTPLLPNGTRDLANLFAGVDCFFDIDSMTGIDNGNGMGCISTRNLTNHATGLANFTDKQIVDAFRDGVRTDGKTIAPLMPYWVFHNMTDDDAAAMVAYLRTVPGVDHTVRANEPPWSLYNEGIIPKVPVINADSEIPLPRGGINNASAMHGRYLSSMAGLCVDCHTPEVGMPGTLPLDFTRTFGGGRLFPKEALGLIDPSYPALVMVRNLTSDATGLMGWTKDQIKNAISKGKDRDGLSVCAATHGAEISPYAALEPDDLDDIAEYILNLPPVVNDTTTCTGPGCGNCAGPPVP
jgi:mono/diheme cytochrome c family protein